MYFVCCGLTILHNDRRFCAIFDTVVLFLTLIFQFSEQYRPNVPEMSEGISWASCCNTRLWAWPVQTSETPSATSLTICHYYYHYHHDYYGITNMAYHQRYSFHARMPSCWFSLSPVWGLCRLECVCLLNFVFVFFSYCDFIFVCFDAAFVRINVFIIIIILIMFWGALLWT